MANPWECLYVSACVHESNTGHVECAATDMGTCHACRVADLFPRCCCRLRVVTSLCINRCCGEALLRRTRW
eukprot:3185059-Prymnesium_polylepis.2